MENVKNFKGYGFLIAVFAFITVLAGGYHEYVAALGAGLLLSYFLYMSIKNGLVTLKINTVTVSIAVILLFYLLTVFWAVDSGMAFIGFIRFTAIFAFLLLLFTLPSAKEKILEFLPFFSALLTIISIPLMFVSSLDGIFSVADRLAGFFQYPNTFALFLLVSELLIVFKDKYKTIDAIIGIILVIGIILTGSRTVFALAIVFNIVALFMKKNKRVRIFTAIALLFVICIAICLAVFSDISLFDRFTSFSLSESTFLGRLLYFYDAIPVILKNPFGLGYMGYYYIQQSVQTGVYSVTHVHNDFLQLFLDIGWVPAVLFIIGIVKTVFSKKTSGRDRLILTVMTAHCCFDFDLQFVCVFMLYILFLNFNTGKTVSFKVRKAALVLSTGVMVLLCAYMGMALLLHRVGAYRLANALYPYNTQTHIMMINESEDLKESNQLADRILERNEHITLAYSAKARYAFSKGDFAEVITNENEIIKRAPFAYKEYRDYCYMLISGISLYIKQGDEVSINICRNQLISTYDLLTSMENNLSYLGKRIKDQPQTELEAEIKEYIEELRNK